MGKPGGAGAELLASAADDTRSQGASARSDGFRVVVMGDFNTGKSTLVNALVGKLIVPVKAMESTAIITRLRYGAPQRAEVVLKDAGSDPTVESLDLAEFRKKYQLGSDIALDEDEELALAKPFANVDHASVYDEFELCWPGVELVDTPGLGFSPSLTARTTEWIVDADTVIFVLNALKPLTTQEKLAIRAVVGADGASNVFFVFNKWNLVGANELDPEQDRADVRELLMRELPKYLAPPLREVPEQRCFFVDALTALKSRIELLPKDAIKATGFVEFEQSFSKFVESNLHLDKAHAESRVGLPLAIPDAVKSPASSLDEIGSLLLFLGDQKNLSRVQALSAYLTSPTFNIVLFGEFNNGKSSLINALIGLVDEKPVLPARLRATTGHVTRLTHGENQVRVTKTDGALETTPLDKIEELVTLDLEQRARGDIAGIEVQVASPFLAEGLALIDTPGLADSSAQTERALEAVRSADLVLMVLHAHKLLTDQERAQAGNWVVGKLGKPLVPVLNWLNTMTEEADRADVRDTLDRWTRRRVSQEFAVPWFEINALGALHYKLGAAEPPEDDFERLATALASCVGERRVEMQRRARLGQALHDLGVVSAANGRVLNELKQGAADLAAERRREIARAKTRLKRLTESKDRAQNRFETTLNDRLGAELSTMLALDLYTEDRTWMEQNVPARYHQRFRAATSAADELAVASVRALHSPRDQPMVQLDLEELFACATNVKLAGFTVGEDTAGGAVAGAIFGAVAGSWVPVVGTIAGAVVGAGVGAIWGRLKADKTPLPERYRTQIRTHWTADSEKVTSLAMIAWETQYDAELAELKATIASIEHAQQLAAVDELALRQALQRELDAALSEARAGLAQAD